MKNCAVLRKSYSAFFNLLVHYLVIFILLKVFLHQFIMMIYITFRLFCSRFLFETVYEIFTRRFLLQLLLEPEKMFVYVIYTMPHTVCGVSFWSMRFSCQRQFAFFYDNCRATTSSFQLRQKNTSKHKLFYVSGLSAETTCADFIKLLTGSICCFFKKMSSIKL